jgi:drug/metabolite transporter (DMT)-like permease
VLPSALGEIKETAFMLWLFYGLGAALFVGIKNVWIRSFAASVSQSTLVMTNFLVTGVLATAYVSATGVPEIHQDFYWAVGVASLIDVLGVTFLTRALSAGDLSAAYPLVALIPVFAVGTSFIILGEMPSPVGLAGVLTIVVGSYLLRIEGAREHILRPFILLVREAGPRFFLLAGLIFAIIAPLFKTAMINSSPAFTLAVSQLLSSVWLAVVLLFRGTLFRTMHQLGRNLLPLGGIGGLNFVQAMFMFFGFYLAKVAYLASIKRLDILFTVLLSAIVFRDRNALRGALSGVVMLAGVVLVSFG